MNPLRGYQHFADDARPMTKLVIASVLLFSAMFVPFVGHMIVVGWMGMTLRDSVRGVRGLAPLDWDFDRLIHYLILGGETYLTLILWSIPFTALAGVVCLCGGLFGVLATAVAKLSPVALALAIPAVFAIATAVVVLGSLPGHVAAMRVMITGDMEEGFRFGEVMRFTGRYFLPLFIGMTLTWIVGIPVTILGTLCCFIGAYPAYVLTHVSSNDVLAQVYADALRDGMPPLPIGDGPPPPVGA